MNPSTDLRLRTMMRGLSEVIVPAIDADNSLAREQAMLLLGHLNALCLQAGREPALNAIEHAELRTLAHELLTHSDGGPATRDAASALREVLRASDIDALAHATERLLIEAGVDGSHEFRQHSERLGREHARQQIRRGRAWFKAMGFDPAPESLPDIDTLLDEERP